MKYAMHRLFLGLVLSIGTCAPALAKVKEVQLTPKVTQQVAERARAQQKGFCSVGEIIGSLPHGLEWEADLKKSALIGFHEQGASVNNSFWSRFTCQQPRWNVLGFRVALSVPLGDLPPGNKPFLAYLSFARLSPDAAKQLYPLLPGVGIGEPAGPASKVSKLIPGIGLDSSKGLLCVKTGTAGDNLLQHLYMYQGNAGLNEQCGIGEFPPPQGSIATVLLQKNGRYQANVTALLMQARQNKQTTARLVIYGLPAPSAGGIWPSQSSSQLTALHDWKLSVVADECNWSTFPGDCK
jgi:hypothetical protein